MWALLPIVQKLIMDYIMKKAHSGFSLNLTALGLMAATALLGFMVFLFLIFAGQTFAAELYGEPLSWLLTAAAIFILACITYICASRSIQKKAIMHKVSKAKEEVADRLTPVAQFIEQMVEPVKDHPLAAIVLAGLAGVMAGDKLHREKGTESQKTPFDINSFLERIIK